MSPKSKRMVVTVADIESASSTISIPDNALITPLARDAAEKRGIRIIRQQDSPMSKTQTQRARIDLTELCRRIDHTNLAPSASEADIVRLCDEAKEHGFATVCVSPTHVRLAAAQCAGSSTYVCSVVGFPSGMHHTATKVSEAQAVVRDGATEIDMVANAGLLVDDRMSDYVADIDAVRQAIGAEAVLKVIIEASLLSDGDIVRAATCAAHAGADFVKTSTGVYGQARLEHVQLLRQILEPPVRIKAAGGIKTVEHALALIGAGADRLGTSSSMSLIREWRV